MDTAQRRQIRDAIRVLTALFALGLAGLAGCRSAAVRSESANGKAGGDILKDADFRWPHGKTAAISLTFDDARLGQVDRGLSILDRHGVKATFYVSPANMEKRLEAWRKTLLDGHEIGNHTMTHPCSGNFTWSRDKALEGHTIETIAADIDRASEVIESRLGAAPVTFAYPCGQKFIGRGAQVRSYVPVVAEKFLVGRGAFDEIGNDPAYCDLAQVTGVDMDGLGIEQLMKIVSSARDEGRWLVLFGHEVGEAARQTTDASALDALCRYASDPANGIWIDTAAAIGGYILNQRGASVYGSRPGHDVKQRVANTLPEE